MLDALARTYAGLRLFDHVLPMAEDAYTIRSKNLRPDHPDRIKAKSLLGQAYYFDGQPEKAKQVLEEALQLAKQHVREKSILVFVCRNDLVTVYRTLGDVKRSIVVGERNLERASETLGHGNPRTLRYMVNLATSYHILGRTDQALVLAEKTIALRESLGKSHPTTLAAAKGLAKIYLEVGQFAEAVDLFKEIAEVEKSSLG